MPSIAEQIELLRVRERNVRPAYTLLAVPRPVERPRGSDEELRLVRVRSASVTRGPWPRRPPMTDRDAGEAGRQD